jgi:Family of unknown function (DUF6519)
MRSDFSNLTFHPSRGHSRVLMQQGQLVTDAQNNEQTSILLHLIRTLTADLLGPHGGPVDQAGFGLQVVKTAAELAQAQEKFGTAGPGPGPDLEAQLQDFGGSLPLLLPGRYYLDGLLIESARLSSLWHQPFGTLAASKGRFLLVLEAWEQQLSAVDQPELDDVAFAPARGADRARVVWRVRALEADGVPTNPGPDEAWWASRLNTLSGLPGERGLLSAGVQLPPDSDSPCLADPEDGYRGETGQLVRVEVHAAGPVGTATVKWSFDNASVQAAWTGVVDDSTLRFQPGGVVGDFRAGSWVELSGVQNDLDGLPGLLLEVTAVDDDELHLSGVPTAAGLTLQGLHDRLTAGGRTASVRLWDQQPEAGVPDWSGGARVVQENVDLDLGLGVQVRFHSGPVAAVAAQPRQYRSGDYWLVLARPGLVQALQGEYSTLQPDGSVSPYGPDRHHAPLALVDVSASQALTVVADHRRLLPPLPFQNVQP